VVVAARDEKFWRNLCDALGRPDLKDDPRTKDNASRVANRDFVEQTLEAIFPTRSRAEWLAILDENDIPNAPVNDIEEVFADEQVRAREMVRTYDHPTLGDVRYPPSPMKFGSWEFPNQPAPMLGQHTIEVLGDRLGVEEAEVRALAAEGVVKLWPEDE
jgi:crotonobetainyl-CoA:carnitine CoA-transferase CaiB-like acyl-CoA transferase